MKEQQIYAGEYEENGEISSRMPQAMLVNEYKHYRHMLVEECKRCKHKGGKKCGSGTLARSGCDKELKDRLESNTAY